MFQPPGNPARGLFHVVAALYKRAMSHPRAGLSTLAVHAGTPQGPNAPLTVPIVQSTTFRFESAAQVQEYARGSSGLFMYSRDENPTVRAAEEAVALLEGAESAVVFGSGMGAMTAALMGLVSAGDEVIAATALYRGTYKLLRDVLHRFRVQLRPGGAHPLTRGPAAWPGPR